MFHLVDFYQLMWATCGVIAGLILVILDIMDADKKAFEVERGIKLRKKLNRAMMADVD